MTDNNSTEDHTTNPTHLAAAKGLDTVVEPDLSQHYLDLASQIWRVCPPILLAVGTLGNLMSILVLSRKAMRQSNAAIYLIVLAGVDLVVLYTGLLRHWVREFFHVDVRSLGRASCRVHTWLVYASLDISVWVLVALTFERLVSVYLPHRVKKHCTMMTSFITIGVIVVAMLAINSHFLYGLGNVYRRERGKWVLHKECTFIFPDYHHFGFKVWPWIDLCLYSLIPLSIVIVSNIAIVIKVCISRRRARRVHPSSSVTFADSSRQGQGGQAKKLSSMTAMLIVLNVVLMITTVPVSAYLIAEPYILADGVSREKEAQIRVVWAVVNLLQYTNHAINFLLYCLSGSRFREELRAMFQRRRRVAPLNATNTHVSDVPLNRLRCLEGAKTASQQGKGKGEEEEEGVVPTTATATTTLTTTTTPTDQHRAPTPTLCTLQPPPLCVHFSPFFPCQGFPPPYQEHPDPEGRNPAGNLHVNHLQQRNPDPEKMLESSDNNKDRSKTERRSDAENEQRIDDDFHHNDDFNDEVFSHDEGISDGFATSESDHNGAPNDLPSSKTGPETQAIETGNPDRPQGTSSEELDGNATDSEVTKNTSEKGRSGMAHRCGTDLQTQNDDPGKSSSA